MVFPGKRQFFFNVFFFRIPIGRFFFGGDPSNVFFCFAPCPQMINGLPLKKTRSIKYTLYNTEIFLSDIILNIHIHVLQERF